MTFAARTTTIAAALFATLLIAAAQQPRPTPPTRDPHTPGYVRATELPDVDMKGFTPEQKTAVLKRLNSESCTCGCKLTIAQCRINDTSCAVSAKLAAEIVNEVRTGLRPPPLPAASASSAPASAGTSVN